MPQFATTARQACDAALAICAAFALQQALTIALFLDHRHLPRADPGDDFPDRRQFSPVHSRRNVG